MNRRIRLAAAALAALTVCAGTPAVATANEDPHARLADSYASLSGSLIDFYADRSGASLQTFLDSADLTVVPAPDTAPALDEETDDFTGLQVDPATAAALVAGGSSAGALNAADLGALNATLAASGATLDTGEFTSLSKVARKVTRAAGTPDGAVTLASAKWLNQLSQLRAPKLKNPGTQAVSTPGVPADALPFGLLMNKSLTRLVVDHPNLVAQAQATGLGNRKLQQAWNTSMAKAYAENGTALTSLLPSPCVGDMMAVMATGKKSSASGNCSQACVVAGQYLHHQAGAAFNNQQNSLSSNAANPAGGVLNLSSFSSMPLWSQQLLAGQNTQLTAPSDVSKPGHSPSDCTDASKAMKNSLGSSLPGLFAHLR